VEGAVLNVFESISKCGHDEDYVPAPATFATDDLPGSWGKIETLAKRVACGEDLWHPEDKCQHITTVELQNDALTKIKIATAGNRTSKEFIARRAKMNLKTA
jgi:hypothetical protein